MTRYHYRYLCNVEPDAERGAGLAKFARFHSDDPYHEGDLMLDAWSGEVEADDPERAADVVFHLHNADDRPTGRICPSMSIGDVAVIGGDGEAVAFACRPIGWMRVAVPTNLYAGTWEALTAAWR